jgi:hypothetical protein
MLASAQAKAKQADWRVDDWRNECGACALRLTVSVRRHFRSLQQLPNITTRPRPPTSERLVGVYPAHKQVIVERGI